MPLDHDSMLFTHERSLAFDESDPLRALRIGATIVPPERPGPVGPQPGEPVPRPQPTPIEPDPAPIVPDPEPEVPKPDPEPIVPDPERPVPSS